MIVCHGYYDILPFVSWIYALYNGDTTKSMIQGGMTHAQRDTKITICFRLYGRCPSPYYPKIAGN
jgi:hypothetical protein